jgi:6-pyruvoyltetrahydropterin/6-carboxytetrahydropterin synthase
MAIAYLTRRAVFCASHRLHSPQLSDEENRRVFGKCNHPNGHGHNYELQVTVRGEIDPRTGMILNLTVLKAAMEEAILRHVDHRHLNLDVEAFRDVNPTAENMAVVFWRLLEPKLPRGALHEVRILETENNFAAYRGE